MSAVCRLRTAAWYGDHEIELPVPDGWDLTVHTPRTPAPLSDAEIDAALRQPVGQEPISRLAAGRSRPLIIVDDLTRPTPAERIPPRLRRPPPPPPPRGADPPRHPAPARRGGHPRRRRHDPARDRHASGHARGRDRT